MARIDRALLAHPDEPMLLRLRGETLVERELARPVAERNFSAAAALAARLSALDSSSVALRFCARVAGLAGDAAHSVALAERATARTPDCVACFDTLAVARLAAGNLDGAMQAEATAVRLLPDGMIDRAMLRRLEEMKAEAKRR
jgi:predicted Zn-dependent protease